VKHKLMIILLPLPLLLLPPLSLTPQFYFSCEFSSGGLIFGATLKLVSK